MEPNEKVTAIYIDDMPPGNRIRVLGICCPKCGHEIEVSNITIPELGALREENEERYLILFSQCKDILKERDALRTENALLKDSTKVSKYMAEAIALEKENEKLRKVVDAAREYRDRFAQNTQKPYDKIEAALFKVDDALRELDSSLTSDVNSKNTGKCNQGVVRPPAKFVKCGCICDCSEMIEEGSYRCWGCSTTNCG